MALDYCFVAPLVVLFDEENFVSRSVTRTSAERYDLCTLHIHKGYLSVNQKHAAFVTSFKIRGDS